jgi:UPF0755 protein
MIYFLCVIGVSVFLAGFGWMCADDMLALTKDENDYTITVSETDSVSDVAGKLKELGVIKYGWLFKLFGVVYNADEKIDPGSYEINSIMDYRALVSAMRNTSSYRSTVSVTIPEGFTLEQAIERLANKGVNTAEALREVCYDYDYEYSFTEELKNGEKRLEGYLFPDTYEFYVNETPVSAIGKLLSNFNKKFTVSMRERAEELGYTVNEILTIASLIEKEAAAKDGNEERAKISSVIHNRLNSTNYPKLQIDATIQYVLPERKERLSYADLEVESPYNTYKYEGLPPGPICNPGEEAIKAALYPASTKFYFYALTDDGTHEFSRNAEEHQAVIDANPGVYGARN